MVVWGGLRPIASRVIFDALAVAGLSFATLTSVTFPAKKTDGNKVARQNRWNGWALIASLVLTVATAGNLTNRWPLTFPMVPLFLLQSLRRFRVVETSRSWSFWIIRILSALCIVMAIKLSILFPAVELPPIEGPYHVGTIDLHIPTTIQGAAAATADFPFSHLPVRILYPTLEEPSWTPYLSPETALEYCRETMQFGAPEPLRDFGWMLHTWRLTGIQAKKNAKLSPTNDKSKENDDESKTKFPIVIYSHGLGGNADIYSYQTLSLAAKGNVVVVMNHLDGTGPIVKTKCGQEVTFDHGISKMDYKEGDVIRRNQTNVRAHEVVRATEAVLDMNQKDTPELIDAGVSFQGRLLVDHVTVMGHSFGGVTAFTAAHRRPDLFQALVAHEPATNWMTDEARRAFFAKNRLEGLNLDDEMYSRFLDGENEDIQEDDFFPELDYLILFSHEWREKKWGRCDIFEKMHEGGRLGPKDGVSHFSFIGEAHHNEFSDTCMLTPMW